MKKLNRDETEHASYYYKASGVDKRIAELEALCLNALYHHQGASSAVGQPIRKSLGMGEFDRLTEAQLKIIQNVRAPSAPEQMRLKKTKAAVNAYLGAKI
jgi:hypothetical protein